METDTTGEMDITAAVLDAALPEVPFDGWSEATLRRAIESAEVDPHEAKMAFPRGAIDLAAAAHKAGDAEMLKQLEAMPLSDMRIRERVSAAVRVRLEIAGEHEEAVRRAVAFFALPGNAAEGARLTWGTADAIWSALGDSSTDYNWYSKRAILSGVYTSTLLCWLGDNAPDKAETWAFLDRRIGNVMQFEKVKAKVEKNPLAKLALAGPMALLSIVKAPDRSTHPSGAPSGFPGRS